MIYYQGKRKVVWDNPDLKSHGHSGGLVTSATCGVASILVSWARGNAYQSPLGRIYILSLRIGQEEVLQYFITKEEAVKEIDGVIARRKYPYDDAAATNAFFFTLCLKAISIEEIFQAIYDIGVVDGRKQQQKTIRETLGIILGIEP